jgi:hypothetical protein
MLKSVCFCFLMGDGETSKKTYIYADIFTARVHVLCTVGTRALSLRDLKL